MVSCAYKKSPKDAYVSDIDSVVMTDSMRPDMPPSLPDIEHSDGHRPLPSTGGMHYDEPSPDDEVHHEPDNMRGFDPASEDDMEDNGMSRYMEKRVNSESRAMLA